MLLGAHESTSGGLHEAFARALADGAEAVQIFAKSSRMWRAKEITPADAATFRAAAALPVTVHASYLVNLGADPGDLREKSIAAFVDELQRCDLLGIPQLVVHPGANADRQRGLRNVADALDRTFAAHSGRCQVLLETAAGQGSCLGSRFEELRRIRDLSKSPDRIAICVDTCHVFAAGYDVASEKGYEATFDELDRVVGLKLVRAFHLNDSMKPLGCRVDRHEHVCKGEIGPLAFRKLVNDERFRDVPGYLEIPPEGNRACLSRLKKLRTSFLDRARPGARCAGPPGPVRLRTFMSPPSPQIERLEPPGTDEQVRFRLRKLLAVARTHKRALVLTHDNPDPDAVASACGLAFLLQECAHVHAQPAYGGMIGRAENKALLKVLHLSIQPVGRIEASQYDLVCLVDTQPEVGNYSLAARSAPELVIDHHPARPASLLSAFHDVGGPAGATSTLVTQYLRAARLVPNPTLATALFYGIKSDTRDLGREVEGADVDCYNWLFPHVDKQALSRIEHPQVPARYFAAYHNAYERARLHGNGQACVVHLGDVYVPEIVPEVAERLVSLEALRWSLATGSYKGELYLSLRLNDRRFNAGKLVREVCSAFGGSAGGHGAMAGARIPLDGRDPDALGQELAAAFLKVFHLRVGPGTPLVPQS